MLSDLVSILHDLDYAKPGAGAALKAWLDDDGLDIISFNRQVEGGAYGEWPRVLWRNVLRRFVEGPTKREGAA